MANEKVCPACNRSISLRLGHIAQQGRVRIANVGFVHRSCFERNKNKFYSLSMAKTMEKGQIDEIPSECVDTTEWMDHDFEEGLESTWYGGPRLVDPVQ